MLTMQMGSHSVLVSGELQIRQSLTLAEAEELLHRIDDRLMEDVPEVHDTFWEINGSRR